MKGLVGILIAGGFLLSFCLPIWGHQMPYVGCHSKPQEEEDANKYNPFEKKVVEVDDTSDRGDDLWYDIDMEDSFDNPWICVSACRKAFFRYAGVSHVNAQFNDLKCICGGSFGKYGNGNCSNCKYYAELSCGSLDSDSIYDTNHFTPSAPRQIILQERTSNSLRVAWSKPVAINGALTLYKVEANPIFSYSQEQLRTKVWELSRESLETYLIGLTPATQYNVSVTPSNEYGLGASASAALWTKITIPDTPPAPTIDWEHRIQMKISITPATNTKGPITSYRIAMIDDSQTAFFNKNHVVTWNETINVGYPYYIAAEFSPEDLPEKFLVGNGATYGAFFNGPIPKRNGHWHPSLGVISTMDGVTESSFSLTSHDQHSRAAYKYYEHQSVFDPENEDKSIEVIIEQDGPLVTFLWIGIALASCIFLFCVAVFFLLQSSVFQKRSTQNRPQTQAFENHQLARRDNYDNAVEFQNLEGNGYFHTGFIHDEDMKRMCLNKLQQVWYVPRNFLEIPSPDDESNVQLVSNGRYGPVYLSMLKNNQTIVFLYSADSKIFKQDEECLEDPEKLYKDVDELVKISKHDNVLELIGFMEEQEIMYFVFEYSGTPLKEYLLAFRNQENHSMTYDPSPYSLLYCAMSIAEGMDHLHSLQINHGNLAACNIVVTDLEHPKVSGFGILSSNPLNEERDVRRWASVETFHNRCIKPCDLWSFGILFWEIVSFGATPFFDTSKEDLSKKITRGGRPAQFDGVGDSVYQIMLCCWQLDRDERPSFASLSCSIHDLLSHAQNCLNISRSSHIPPYVHDLEYNKI